MLSVPQYFLFWGVASIRFQYASILAVYTGSMASVRKQCLTRKTHIENTRADAGASVMTRQTDVGVRIAKGRVAATVLVIVIVRVCQRVGAHVRQVGAQTVRVRPREQRVFTARVKFVDAHRPRVHDRERVEIHLHLQLHSQAKSVEKLK